MEIEVALKRSREGYAVWCPGLPGCCSQGRTKAEAIENIKDAIMDYRKAARLSIGKNAKLVKVRLAV